VSISEFFDYKENKENMKIWLLSLFNYNNALLAVTDSVTVTESVIQ